MKIARGLLFFLVSVIITTALLSFFQPTSQRIQKSVVINKSAADVYAVLGKLDNFKKFSVWTQQDSAAVYQMKGIDGITGASETWQGDPMISGKGEITITALIPGQKVSHRIQFLEPKKKTAESVFIMTETNKAVTKLEWIFTLHTSRPANIFNLFYNIEKEMGSDFDSSLLSLKKLVEQSPNP